MSTKQMELSSNDGVTYEEVDKKERFEVQENVCYGEVGVIKNKEDRGKLANYNRNNCSIKVFLLLFFAIVLSCCWAQLVPA